MPLYSKKKFTLVRRFLKLPAATGHRKRKKPPSTPSSRTALNDVTNTLNTTPSYSTPSSKVTPEEIKNARDLYVLANQSFEEKHGTPITNVIPSIPGVRLVRKQTAAEIKVEKTNLARSFKRSVKEIFQKENHDVFAVYGTSRALNRHDQRTSYEYFVDR